MRKEPAFHNNWPKEVKSVQAIIKRNPALGENVVATGIIPSIKFRLLLRTLAWQLKHQPTFPPL